MPRLLDELWQLNNFKMGFLTFDQTKRWMVAAHLERRPLLIAVNALAGMSIFFFGMYTDIDY